MTKTRFNSKVFIGLALVVALLISFAATTFAATRPAWAQNITGFAGQAQQVQNVLQYQNKMDKIRVVEPNWVPPTEVKPLDDIVKQVKVRNGHNYEGYAVIKVSIPTIMAKKEGDTTEKVYDQFTPDWNTTDYELLYKKVSTVAGTDSVYYYGLKKSLRVGEYSKYLFEHMTVPYFVYVGQAASDAVIVDAAFINKKDPVTNQDMTSVREAFEIMGDWVPADYTR